MTTATGLRASIDLPVVAGSVPVARGVVEQILGGWSAHAVRDDAVLLLSELVTNVVRHVPPSAPLRIELHLSGPVLRVAVLDASPAPPDPVEPGAAGGHGLRLVTALAGRWGAERRGDGKRVWFELTP